MLKFATDKKIFLTEQLVPKPINKFTLLTKIDLGDSSKTDLGDINLTFSKINKTTMSDYVLKISNLVKISDVTDGYDKLLDKIEFCKISGDKANTKKYLENLRSLITCEIEKSHIEYENKFLSELFTDYTTHCNFMVKTKSLAIINVLLESLENEDSFCSQIKILKSISDSRKYNYHYNFELLFETIMGYELLDEQFTRYNYTIKNYLSTLPNSEKFAYSKNLTPKIFSTEYPIVKYQQVGGNIYPLHHFMMGKGKSSTMTPLLALYFILIYDMKIYVIMPEHLVNDSFYFINQYMHINNCESNITICSDTTIKTKFLESEFDNIEANKQTIFIIDEFDSLLDPLKSNFNIVENKTVPVLDFAKFIYSKVKKLKHGEYIKYSEEISPIDKIILSDINNIIKSIESYNLVENINWGIDKNKCYAIPYNKKDKPAINSNFSSVILTIFLTLYYYIVINDWKISEFMIEYIIKFGLYETIFKIHKPNENIFEKTYEIIKLNSEIKDLFFDEFFQTIFSKIMIPEHQKNTSFVDILNIDHIYKIGYSGTVNLELPVFTRTDNKFADIYVDNDEFINVSYALDKANLFTIDKKVLLDSHDLNFFKYLKEQNRIDLNEYDSLIDQYGIFKNIPNKTISEILWKIFNLEKPSRDIIYITESDQKIIIDKNGKETNYISSVKYSKPFIYYSQAHIIGVDIKQDYYPNMKGLITVGPNSLYTNVAQAIFRLRKINLGHSIDILYLYESSDYVPTESFKVLELLKCNDEKLKLNKHDLLIYQTIKSEIRKKRKQNNVDNNCAYMETIKHYWNNDNLPSEISQYYDGIFTLEELEYEETKKLFKLINTPDKLNKIILNINNYSESVDTIITKETETLVNINTEITSENDDLSYYINLNYDFIKYEWEHIGKLDVFYNLTIPLNDFISTVPNINCQSNGSMFKPNKSGYAYVYIHQLDKLLLIPGYMVPYFYDKFIILDSKFLYLINSNKISEYQNNYVKINQMKTNKFLQFIEKGTINEDSLDYFEVFLTYLILSEYSNLLLEHTDLIDWFKKDFTTISIRVSEKFSQWVKTRTKGIITHKITLYETLPTDLTLFGIEPPPQPKILTKTTVASSRYDPDDSWGGANILYKKYAITYE